MSTESSFISFFSVNYLWAIEITTLSVDPSAHSLERLSRLCTVVENYLQTNLNLRCDLI